MSEIDPRTPVLVGVGQYIERIDDEGYVGLSPVDLASRALEAAIADTGNTAVTSVIDTVAGVRQFEISSPQAKAPLGKADNFPRAVAARVGASPREAILEVSGGQAPQHLITELAASIAAGDRRVAVVVGAEAISTTRHFASRDDAPDFSEVVGGQLEDRGYGLTGLITRPLAQHGAASAPDVYALLENARRAWLGLSREDYLSSIGMLFAPFTEVAAVNPFAASHDKRSVAELITRTEANRPIADPYLRLMVSRDQVNQAAAVILMSVGIARELGIGEHRWVFLHGHADLRDRRLIERPELGRSTAAIRAAEHAMEVAGITVDELGAIDLYSCFPVAVTNVADGLGIAAFDPRGLTLTGGLPFFGGPGNNYSLHAVAEVVEYCRRTPNGFGLVGANGGMLDKYSVGIYSSAMAPWRSDRSSELQAELDETPAVAVVLAAEGDASIETYTVKYSRDGSRTAVVVGRLAATAERFVATGFEGDEEFLEHLSSGEPIGTRVHVRSVAGMNRVALTRDRVEQLAPKRRPLLRDDYHYALVTREDHLLIVTMNRPERRNALHPPANEELGEIFDAYFADPDLWVAIITGAGDKAFSAGADLLYATSGRPHYLPRSGFAALTGRRMLPKPVIAAVNGFAMGGGFETALACHLVVADETARFALSEVRVGLIAGAGGTVRLPRQLPAKVAYELLMTGRQMTATEGARLGLINRVAAPGECLKIARQLAEEILNASPVAVRTTLQLVELGGLTADPIDAMNRYSGAIDDLMTSEDMSEGLTAFAEKRSPHWRNR